MVAYSQIKKAAGSNVPMPATPTQTLAAVPKSTTTTVAAAKANPTAGAVPKASGIVSSMANRLTSSKPMAASQTAGAVPRPSTGISAQQVSSAIKNPATSTTQQNGPMDYYAALAQAQQQVNPSYQAAIQSAQSQGWQNNLDAGEMASARGGAQSGLAADLQNKVNINTSSTISNLEAQKAAQAAELAQSLVQQSQQNAYQEAALTGFYKGQQTLDAKNADRNYGLSYADVYGTGLDGKQTAAYQSQMFNQGLSREQQDLANKNANLNAALSVSDITGKVINPQSDWTGLFRQAGNSSTPLTLAGQNQQLNNTQVMATLTGYLPNGQKTSAQQAQELSQLWTVADATGIIPDELANLYGLPSGTKTLQAKQFALQQWQAKDDSALGWANNALAQDDNSRQWAALDADISSSGQQAQTVSGTTAGQMLSQALQKQNGVDEDGKTVYGTYTDPATREKLFVDTWNASGVQSGADTLEMLVKAGYTTAEINAYKKKYPEAFNSGSAAGGGATPVSVKVPQQYATLIETNNRKYGLPDGLLAAIADAESDFNPNARNDSGASGMFQFMPATAKGYGIDPYDPVQAADAAGKMMSGLIAKYGGDVAKALAGYNWGGGNVDKAIKKYGDNWLAYAPAETQKYIKKILG